VYIGANLDFETNNFLLSSESFFSTVFFYYASYINLISSQSSQNIYLYYLNSMNCWLWVNIAAFTHEKSISSPTYLLKQSISHCLFSGHGSFMSACILTFVASCWLLSFYSFSNSADLLLGLLKLFLLDYFLTRKLFSITVVCVADRS
jgi:hypothetical protein